MSLTSNKTVLSGSVELRKAGRTKGEVNGIAGKQTPTESKKEKTSSVVRVFKLFRNYVHHLAIFLLTAAAVLMACSLRGDLALVVIFIYKSYIATTAEKAAVLADNSTTTTPQLNPPDQYQPILPDYLQLPDYYNMTDLLFYIAVGILSSQIMFQGVCGFFQLYFYTLKRDKPEEWKCQPHRFLTNSNEIHEIIVGTINMTMAGFVSGCITCWIVNGNRSTVYFDASEYGYTYFFLSFIFLFMWIEAGTYHFHAFLHIPLMYKNFHKQHHRYHCPTAYSAVAMSPIEFSVFDGIVISPLFLFPIHGLVYVIVVLYIYYFGMMDHSGIKMNSWFPWQPDTMFHDDHHRYFHVNYGLNLQLFDWLYGTLKRSDREYGEDIFGGKGREKGRKE